MGRAQLLDPIDETMKINRTMGKT